MNVSHKKVRDITTPPRSSTALLMRSVADTTWRMFVPTIGGALLGVAGDNFFVSSPWFSLLGSVLGCGVTAMLIKNQFSKKI